MTSDRRFFSGDSLPQALNQAAQQFQCSPDSIKYKLVEKRHGFLKVRRKVVIEVDGANPILDGPAAGAATGAREESTAATRAPAAPPASPAPKARPVAAPEMPPAPEGDSARPEPSSGPGANGEGSARMDEEVTADWRTIPEPRSEGSTEAARDQAQGADFALPEAPTPARSRYPTADGEEAGAAADALARILELAGLDLESEILRGEEELLVELWGEDQDILLRDRGRLLLAIQHLLPRAIRGLIGRSVACRVDSDDFHMIREERLRDLAQRAADEVRHHGRPKTLEPMSPDERRIVHLTLADYPGVETESHGSGLFKRVMVRAARGERPRGSYKR